MAGERFCNFCHHPQSVHITYSPLMIRNISDNELNILQNIETEGGKTTYYPHSNVE